MVQFADANNIISNYFVNNEQYTGPKMKTHESSKAYISYDGDKN